VKKLAISNRFDNQTVVERLPLLAMGTIAAHPKRLEPHPVSPEAVPF
jgi:hypothetical protein